MKRVIALALGLAACGSAAADCRDTTVELDSMTSAELVMTGPGQRAETLAVRVADDSRERGGGFQHICPEIIQETAIYFVFERPRRPSFHMHNVKAPLDIAFMDEDGRVVDIQRMEPYVLGASKYPRYSPPSSVLTALETRAGFFAEKRITPGEWTIQLPEQ